MNLRKNLSGQLPYRVAMVEPTRTLTHIFIRMIAEPGVIERIFGPLTVMSLLPDALVMRRRGSDSVFVLARFIGIDPDRAVLIAGKLRSMPSVRNAKISLSVPS